MEVTNTRRTLLKFGEQGMVSITPEFLAQVKYLCAKVSQIEWSGLVFYTVEGDFQDFKSLCITPQYIHLMDIGTAGATEFDDDGSLKKLYEDKPELNPFLGTDHKYGKIHSHHNMDVYHSATDMQDLQDQAGNYDDYYFSLIVNNAMEMDAKIAFVATLPEKKVVPTKFEGPSWNVELEDYLGVIDMDILDYEENLEVDVNFLERFTAVKEAKKEESTKRVGWYQGGGWPKSRPNPQNWKPQLNNPMLDYYEEEEESPLDSSKLGKIALTAFFNSYFKLKPGADLEDAAEIVEAASLDNQRIVQTALVKWFNRLPEASQERVIAYTYDADQTSLDAYPEFEELLEGLWTEVK